MFGFLNFRTRNLEFRDQYGLIYSVRIDREKPLKVGRNLEEPGNLSVPLEGSWVSKLTPETRDLFCRGHNPDAVFKALMAVSRRQGLIYLSDGGNLFYQDSDSLNGSRIIRERNPDRFMVLYDSDQEAPFRRFPLKQGDYLELGRGMTLQLLRISRI